jgi:hypothetical protein
MGKENVMKVESVMSRENVMKKENVMKIKRVMKHFVLCISLFIFVSSAAATPVLIELTSNALGLGPDAINHAKNNNLVDADIAGKFITSTDAGIGSILYINSEGLAGGVGTNDLLMTVTARSHMSIQTGIPEGSDIHAGIITLSAGGTGSLSDQGLGVRAFTIDTIGTAETNSNFGKRYFDRMEGSREVSGGTDPITTWDAFVDDSKAIPSNNPPHVNEDVTFDFNNEAFSIAGNTVSVLLTRLDNRTKKTIPTEDPGPLKVGLDLTINLLGGTQIYKTWGNISQVDEEGLFSLFEDYDDVVKIDFSALTEITSGSIIDSFIIGARPDDIDADDETDEHFLINGLMLEDVAIIEIPEPATFLVLGLGWLVVRIRRA